VEIFKDKSGMMLMPHMAVMDQIEHLLAFQPVVALLGPRQCGKTTIAKMLAER